MQKSLTPDLEPESSFQPVDTVWLAAWLKAFQEEQVMQTKYLRNISTVATLIGVLILLGFALGICSMLTGF